MLRHLIQFIFYWSSILGVYEIVYRVGLVVWQLGWVDLDLGSSPGWWAATVATYCPSRMVEHPKSQPRFATRWVTLYVFCIPQ